MCTRIQGILLALFTLLVAGCANLPSEDKLANGETYLVSMDVDADGYQRSYRVHIPADYRAGEPTPLVVVVHGAFSTSRAMEEETGFSTLADKEGFIVVYPDGIGILGLLQHWNAGHCCGKAAADDVDDVGFVANVIEHVNGYAAIDRNRVYMVGFSNGAMLTHRFAAERPELLAGAAPLAGAIGSVDGTGQSRWQIPATRSALPIIMFHGLHDERVPYRQPDPESASGVRRYSSVIDSSRYWSSQNGCEQHHRIDGVPATGFSVDTWSGCNENVTVQLITLNEWGHQWPGRYFTDKADPQSAIFGFDAAQFIWSFFQRHSREKRNA